MRIFLKIGFAISIVLAITTSSAQSQIKQHGLFDAVIDNNCDSIAYFLKKGTAIDTLNYWGKTPLLYAIDNYKENCEELLQKKGRRKTSFSKAFGDILIAIITLGLKKPKKTEYYDITCTKIETLNCLLNKGANINNPGSTQHNPLSYAIKTEQDELVDFFIEKGANIDYTNPGGKTALHYAIAYKNNYAFEKLLNAGVNVNRKDASNATPLKMILIDNWNNSSIQTLVNHGAEVNDKYQDGTTPLHLLIQKKRSFSTIKLFVEKGADVNAKDNNKKTPIQYTEDKEIRKYLRKNGASPKRLHAFAKGVGRVAQNTSYFLTDDLMLHPYLATNYSNGYFRFEPGVYTGSFLMYDDEYAAPGFLGYSLELGADYFTDFNSRHILGPKLTGYAFLVFVQLGASAGYHTDFSNSNFSLQPFVGLTFLGSVDLTYGYNFLLAGEKFNEINGHNFQLKIRFPLEF